MEYTSLREKIRAESKQRAEKHERFQAMLEEALAAGNAAGSGITPSTMYIRDTRTGETWAESEGPCGFAWVKVYEKGSSSFGRWFLKNGARKGWNGGLEFWIGGFNQSIERKEACASAMARVFREHGIQAYAESRLD